MTIGTVSSEADKEFHFCRQASSADLTDSSPLEKRSLPDRQRPTLDVLTGLSGADERGLSLKQIRFSQAALSFAPDKRLKNISGREAGRLRSTEVTHTYGGHFQAYMSKGPSYLQRDSHDSRWPLRLMEDSPMREPSRPMVLLSKPRCFHRTL